jgi:multidrug efflux pump subunit AcrA (membrane-fusion protein)
MATTPEYSLFALGAYARTAANATPLPANWVVGDAGREVKTVSADSSSTDNAAPRSPTESSAHMPFRAVIELRSQALIANEAALPLAAGKQVSAEILQGRRTVLEYLLSPVQRVVSEAAMER